MRKILIAVMAMVTIFWFTTPTHAILWDRGGGLIYDDYLKITWLQDVNYAKTSGYDDDGMMRWDQAMTWAENLVYQGYTDWRLPVTVYDGPVTYGYDGTTSAGYNITSSEMGYMYYINLANKGYYDTSGFGPQPGWNPTPNATFIDGNGNIVSFQNLLPTEYFSSTEFSLIPGFFWMFNFRDGEQEIDYIEWYKRAWAVRPGDSAPVPEPTTMLLLGSGLIGLAGYGRKKFFKK